VSGHSDDFQFLEKKKGLPRAKQSAISCRAGNQEKQYKKEAFVVQSWPDYTPRKKNEQVRQKSGTLGFTASGNRGEIGKGRRLKKIAEKKPREEGRMEKGEPRKTWIDKIFFCREEKFGRSV